MQSIVYSKWQPNVVDFILVPPWRHPIDVSSLFLRSSLGFHLPSLINIKTERERKRERYPLDLFECKRDRSSLIILVQRKWFVDGKQFTSISGRGDYLYAEWRIVSIRIIIRSWKKMATCYWNFHRHTRRRERETRLSLPYRRITVCDKPINPVNNCRIISAEMKRCFA